jgi:3-hydroxyisobutyrate dehydrogenase
VNRLNVGFIGLGAIGAPMALRIHEAGHALRVYNRGSVRAQPFAALGVPVAASAAQLAAQCDVVCLCVSDGEAVEQVVFAPDGIAAGGREGLLVVDLSTIHPVHTREMATRLKRRHGMHWVDAPVSGGPAGARAGTLAVLAGGGAEAVERARPVLESFAGRITHMGATGNGMAAKAFNQMLSFNTAAVIAETLNLAAQFGVDPLLMTEAVGGGFADSNVMRSYGRAMVQGTYKGSTKTAVKDIDIAVDLARITGSAIPLTDLTASFFRMALAQGCLDGGLGTPMRLYSKGPLVARPQTDPGEQA